MGERSHLYGVMAKVCGIYNVSRDEFVQEGDMKTENGEKFRYGTEEIPLKIHGQYIIAEEPDIQYKDGIEIVVINRLQEVKRRK